MERLGGKKALLGVYNIRPLSRLNGFLLLNEKRLDDLLGLLEVL